MDVREISTLELNELLRDERSRVVDLRCSDAFNGWKMNHEKRGGHISGAISLPYKWSNYIDWIEIVRSKDIMIEHKVVLYSYFKDECVLVASYFKKAGYNDVMIYTGFLNEYSADISLPMDHLPNFQKLVPVSWVKDLVDGQRPDDVVADNIVLIHAHYRNRKAYLSGHIPGAIDLDTLALESPETWNHRSPAKLKKALEKHGITADTCVVIYGKFMFPDNDDDFPGSAAGHLGAMRCLMIMLYAGVKDIRLLNGGYQAWFDEDYTFSTFDEPKYPVKDFGAQVPSRPELFVDINQAKEMIESLDAEIVSVRSWEEYIGLVSGYNYIEKKGRIPGSVFGNCGSDAYHMENYRNPDHTIRDFHEVEALWAKAGITPDKHLAFYCGTGWRGSEAFVNAWLMGWSNVSVFDGGWFEWSNDPENPFETGYPEKMLQYV